MPPTASNSKPLRRNDEKMKYRPLGKTGLFVSALSFGCMRLQDNPELNAKLLPRAVELGVNYFETARLYLRGTCQHRVAGGTKEIEGKSENLIFSGKSGCGPDTTAFSYRREIERQLEILEITHFKFYQVGWLRWENVPHLLKRGGALEAIRRAQQEGLIQYLGFTGHEEPENTIRIMETGLFDTVTVPYNLVNRSYEKAIARAGELGMGVVAMCPVAGGILSDPAKTMKAALGVEMPTPAAALRFVLSNPNVSTACSGMSTMEMLEENAAVAGSYEPKEGEFKEMCGILDKLLAGIGGPLCTGCEYCAGCPQELPLPQLMEIWQLAKAFHLEDWARERLRGLGENERPERCTDCGLCETKCPNSLNIRQRLKELAGMAK